MSPEEKQAGRNRYKAMLEAALGFLAQQTAGQLVFDQFDIDKQRYSVLQQTMKNDYQQGRLEKLQVMLKNLIEEALYRGYSHIDQYIKEKTGYEVEIFADVQQQVATAIRKMQEAHQNGNGQLTSIQVTEIISSDGTSTVIDNNRYINKSILQARSPDGKKIVTANISGMAEALVTYVQIDFEDGGGGIFSADGDHPELKVYWKDNQTIVIETNKNWVITQQIRTVKNFTTIIQIEYIEQAFCD